MTGTASATLKITPTVHDMLDRIKRATDDDGGLLVLSIAAEGGSAPRRLRTLCAEGLAEACDHPSIVIGSGRPAPAVRITEAGRAAIAAKGRKQA